VNSRRAWVVVAIATVAYIVGVMQRTSLGVAAVEATDRFHIQAAALSSLAVVQIIVYAALQIPVGVVLDRVGPRALILTGAALMGIGQLTLATSTTLGVAIVGRILVGAGDAMTFISVTRLIASWFSGKALPLLTQSVGTVGQLGQVLSAVPLSLVLHAHGWTPAYVSAASFSVVAFALVLVVVRNAPPGAPPTGPIGIRSPMVHTLRESLSRPGTQLGFWSHFITQSSATMITLLWGFPFLSIGLGYGPTRAAELLMLIVIGTVITGPLLGILSARFPLRRSNIVLGIVVSMAIAWIAVLAWPGTPPLWLIVVLLLVIATGGPGSLVGFDFARAFNPARSLGSASGIVNVGGFLATFVMMLLIGVVLDVIDATNGGTGVPAQLYSLSSFRIAFLVQFVVVGTGVIFMLDARRRTRRRLHAEEGITVGPIWVALVRAWRHRGQNGQA
jgi:sugar phosphate permease